MCNFFAGKNTNLMKREFGKPKTDCSKTVEKYSADKNGDAMKKILLLLLILLLAGGYWLHARADAATRQADDEKAVETARAERGDLTVTVSATGKVEPEREVEIKSKASGEVIKVFADVSDEVKQGQMLFKLDPTDEERSVARLKATLAMSQAKLEQVRLGVQAAEAKLKADTARANADLKSAEAENEEYASRLRRSRQLYEQKVISREELDTAVTKAVQTESALANARVKIDDLAVQELELDRTRQEVHIAEAQVETDTVSLDDAQQRLTDTEIFAPITGVVSERSVQEGFIVASGVSNVGGGTTTMKVIDLSRIYALAAVDEADISGVVPGVKAVVTADAYKGMEFDGRVVRVAATGVTESNVVTFDVKVEVDSPRKKLLKPEMTTNVTLIVSEARDVITVPASAIVRRAAKTNEGGGEHSDYSRRQSIVTVRLPDGTTEERQVQVGITDGSRTEIKSGVKEGEEVVLAQNGGDSRWAGSAGRTGMRRPPMR